MEYGELVTARRPSGPLRHDCEAFLDDQHAPAPSPFRASRRHRPLQSCSGKPRDQPRTALRRSRMDGRGGAASHSGLRDARHQHVRTTLGARHTGRRFESDRRTGTTPDRTRSIGYDSRTGTRAGHHAAPTTPSRTTTSAAETCDGLDSTNYSGSSLILGTQRIGLPRRWSRPLGRWCPSRFPNNEPPAKSSR